MKSLIFILVTLSVQISLYLVSSTLLPTDQSVRQPRGRATRLPDTAAALKPLYWNVCCLYGDRAETGWDGLRRADRCLASSGMNIRMFPFDPGRSCDSCSVWVGDFSAGLRQQGVSSLRLEDVNVRRLQGAPTTRALSRYSKRAAALTGGWKHGANLTVFSLCVFGDSNSIEFFLSRAKLYKDELRKLQCPLLVRRAIAIKKL